MVESCETGLWLSAGRGTFAKQFQGVSKQMNGSLSVSVWSREGVVAFIPDTPSSALMMRHKHFSRFLSDNTYPKL